MQGSEASKRPDWPDGIAGLLRLISGCGSGRRLRRLPHWLTFLFLSGGNPQPRPSKGVMGNDAAKAIQGHKFLKTGTSSERRGKTGLHRKAPRPSEERKDYLAPVAA